MLSDPRANARSLAAEYLAKDEPLGWFEQFYQNAASDTKEIPWANLKPNPHLIKWLDENSARRSNSSALVVGCGLGDDAEAISDRDWLTSAIDISATAVTWCKRRFPESKVSYEAVNVLAIPPSYTCKFDFIFEANTLQVLPKTLRSEAMTTIARCLAPGGTLLVVARGREPSDPVGNMPWPLMRKELSVFEHLGLQRQEFKDFLDEENPPVRRFLAVYRRLK